MGQKALSNSTLETYLEIEAGSKEKFWGYRQLPSLREYMLVSQDKVLIEIFSRTEDDTWRIQTLTAPGQSVDLPALGIRLNVEDIYVGMEDIMN